MMMMAEEAGDKRFGAGPSHAVGAGAAGESLVATDQPDGPAEEEGIDEPFVDLPHFHAGAGVMPERAGGNAQEFHADEPPADDPGDIAVNGQHRRQQHAGEESRDDKKLDRIGAHDAQGIELLGDVHGSQFGRQRTADAAGKHHRRQHRPDLLDHREEDDAARGGLPARWL